MRSEAYLEGMKTCRAGTAIIFLFASEAYLEGMKTMPVYSLPCRHGLSEAYLEGMKTFLFPTRFPVGYLRPKPTSKE